MAVPYTFGTATSSIPLSQLDSNFNTVITLGNTAIQLGNTVTTLNNMTLANVTISSGNVTITNVTITTANVTTANIGTAFVSGNVSFTGTGNRITGDFNNATAVNRVAFQNSTTNAQTILTIIPNGTAVTSALSIEGDSAVANGTNATFNLTSTDVRLGSGIRGTGTYLPMTFYTGGSERMRLDTSGNVGIGTSSPASKLNVLGNVNNSANSLGTLDSATLTVQNVNSAALQITSKLNLGVTSNGVTYGYSSIASAYANFNGAGDIGTAMLFGTQTNASGGTVERMRIDSSGNVGIGTTSPSEKLRVTSTGTNEIRSHSSSSGDARVGFWAEGAAYNYIQTVRSSGALSSFADLQTFNNSSGTERARIDSSGNVLVTNPAGLGYGTGSGGTVTQATSRTTGVTLSKPTGAITMFSAAGSVVAATFTVTNTLVAATDTIILNQKSGTNLYVLLVTAVAAGSFNITFYTTGGVATDAPVINFALIKGATS